MNKTKIEWCDYTWNPVIGCRHGCFYCYAERINNRFGYIDNWKEPQLFQNRLNEPLKLKKKSEIFVGSMCDLFGKWVSNIWIESIIEVCRKSHHKFMFLTKNPERYLEFDFPDNCWLGTTIDYDRYGQRTQYLRLCNNSTFVSVEPILSDMTNVDFRGIDLVIIGGQTGKGAKPTPKRWIESVKHNNIFLKSNLITKP